MHNWYLIHTKIRQERVALEHLQRQGFECYLPFLRAERIRRGALQIVQEPLFPRYLFIRLDTGLEARSWSPIRSTQGVCRLVTFGCVPAKIDEQLVSAIRHKSMTQEDPERLFAKDQAVIVTDGPFAGLEAIYQMSDGEGRVMVLLNILNNPVKLTLAPTALRKMGRA